MKIGILIQARMSSVRLPGKPLRRLLGKPLLGYLLERLQHCQRPYPIVVATSVADSDTPIAAFCAAQQVACWRGPLDDVVERFSKVLKVRDWDAFVRLSGDSPLLDQRLVDRAVALFVEGDYDLVTNVYPRTFPRGQSVEVVRTATFQRTRARMQAAADREHVTRYFYEHASDFAIKNFALDPPCVDVHLAVDTLQDFDYVENHVLARQTRPHWEYTVDDLLDARAVVATAERRGSQAPK